MPWVSARFRDVAYGATVRIGDREGTKISDSKVRGEASAFLVRPDELVMTYEAVSKRGRTRGP